MAPISPRRKGDVDSEDTSPVVVSDNYEKSDDNDGKDVDSNEQNPDFDNDLSKEIQLRHDIYMAAEAMAKNDPSYSKVAEDAKKSLDEITKLPGEVDNDSYEKKVISNPSIGAALIEASEEGDDELLEFLENLNIKAFRLKFGLLKRDLEKLTRKKSDAKKVRVLLFELLGFESVPTFKEYENRYKALKPITEKGAIKAKLASKGIDEKETTIDEKAEEIYSLVDVAAKLFEDKEEYHEFIELTESPTITPKRILGATIVAGAASTVALTATLAAALTVGRWGIRKVGNTLSFGADYIDELKLKAPFGELGDSMLRTVVDPLIDVKENTVNETKGAYNWVIEATKKWFGKKEEHPAAEHAPAGAAHGEHADDHAPAAPHAAPAAADHAPAHAPAHGAHGAGHGHAAESKPGMFSKLWSGTKNLASKAWSGTKNLAGNAWGVAKDLPRAARLYSRMAQVFGDDLDYLKELDGLRNEAGVKPHSEAPKFRQDFEKTDTVDLSKMDEYLKKKS